MDRRGARRLTQALCKSDPKRGRSAGLHRGRFGNRDERRLLLNGAGNSLRGCLPEVPGKADLRHAVNAPLRRIPVIPANTVTVIGGEAVMKIVEAFAIGKNGTYPVVAS